MEKPSNKMMRLHNLQPRPGSRHRVKRLGCGESSGHGKTSGKGHKGQKARSGGSIRLGFEGGQMPLIRRLPKRGFNNAAFHRTYAIVNLDDLNDFKPGTLVNEELLRESKLVRGEVSGIKILGNGELRHALKIEADKISTSARHKIEKAGGTIALRESRPAQASRSDQDNSVEVRSSEEAEANSAAATKDKPRRERAVKRGGASKKASARKS
jgi:large subunit ribosomal protein L15